MRINKFVAQASGLSRRAADVAINQSRVEINGHAARLGDNVTAKDVITLNGKRLNTPELTTIILNKPVGYVVSRHGQGSRTIYDLLPSELHHLKPVGRLDKDSSGLLIMTNDGDLANELTHPRFLKNKVYQVELDKPLQPLHHQMIHDRGIMLDDGISRLRLQKQHSAQNWQVIMSEGRNRQIRRTFAALGYRVTELHRTNFGFHELGSLGSGRYKKSNL